MRQHYDILAVTQTGVLFIATVIANHSFVSD